MLSIQDNDTLFFFNYRSDRVREVTQLLGGTDRSPKPDFPYPKNLSITTMTRYNISYPFPVAFEPQHMGNVLAEMIPSPRVATYDLEPKMSAAGVADKLCERIGSNKFEFLMNNFAPPDMVGHTGVYKAAIEAVAETDNAVGKVYEKCKKEGYVLFITADHG